MRRKTASIPKNRCMERPRAVAVTRKRENNEREFLGSKRVLAIADFPCAFPFAAACEIQSKDCFGATPKPIRETRVQPKLRYSPIKS
jgi:hypothetical protein